jgi:type II secretion system protein J
MNRRGFTLLELLLASAISAMMALVIYSAMVTGFKARRSAGAQMSDIRSMAIVMDIIAEDFESILPPTGTLAGPMVGYAMGSPGFETDSVNFYCLGRDRAGVSALSEGFRRIELVLKTDGQTPTLVRRVTRNLLAPAVPEPQDEVLSTEITGFSVRFFDGTSWYDEWDSTLQEDSLPIAVEVTLRKPAARESDRTAPYSITRILPLPCAAPAETEEETTDAQ